jgi:NAD(P)H dehydrogenase (quinone)
MILYGHWGAIVVAPGYTDQSLFAAGGNPYGTSVTVDQNNKMVGDVQAYQNAVKHQTKRVVTVAEWVKKGMQ